MTRIIQTGAAVNRQKIHQIKNENNDQKRDQHAD